jgi:hypothetical protein
MMIRKHDDRRRMPRWAVNLRTDVRFEGLLGTGFVADVNPYGAFVRAAEDADPLMSVLQSADLVQLRFDLPDAEPVEVSARVVHLYEDGLGLEFVQRETRLEGLAPRPAAPVPAFTPAYGL